MAKKMYFKSSVNFDYIEFEINQFFSVNYSMMKLQYSNLVNLVSNK